jgi:hypothetical protein
MNDVTSDAVYVLALVLGVYTVFSIFYTTAIRPMFCDRTRFRLFALRDQLRRLAIDEEVKPSSFEYRYLELMLCRLIDKCAWYSWSSFIEFFVKNRHARQSADSVRFQAKASESLLRIHDGAIVETMKVMLTNSPIWTLTLFFVFCVGYAMGAAWKQAVEIKAKIFVEEPLFDIGVRTA